MLEKIIPTETDVSRLSKYKKIMPDSLVNLLVHFLGDHGGIHPVLRVSRGLDDGRSKLLYRPSVLRLPVE